MATIEETLHRAVGCLQQGRFREAEKLCRDLLVRQPGSVVVMRLLAQTMISTNRADQAFQILSEALDTYQRRIANHGLLSIEYPITPSPRYGFGKPEHPALLAMLEAQEARYQDHARSLAGISGDLLKIPMKASAGDERTPFWSNGWFDFLDSSALVTMISRYRPKRLIEVGSGNSTKFARWAIDRFATETHLTSIDPNPRAVIDELCDQVVRAPLQNADLSVFERLEDGDVLFFDGSHYAFQNSDVTVFFLEVLPYLKNGVIVHIHDIFLPFDYKPEWTRRYYNEQYLLAVALLNGAACEILWPSYYISQRHADFGTWCGAASLPKCPAIGNSFWMRIAKSGSVSP